MELVKKLYGWIAARDGSLAKRIIIPFNVASVVLLSVVATNEVMTKQVELRDAAVRKVAALEKFLVRSSSAYYSAYDFTALEDFSSQLIEYPEIDYCIYLDDKGNPLTQTSKVVEGEGIFHRETQILTPDGEHQGTLKLGYNFSEVNKIIRASVFKFVGMFVMLQVFLSGLLFFIVRAIGKPLIEARNMLVSSASVNGVTSQKLSSAATQLSAASNEQASAVQESVAAMSEMKSMIAQTTDRVQESQAMADSMKLKTDDGSRIMTDMASSMEAIESSNAKLQALVEIISDITDKTKVINDIVFKTQLLSFNASIEAARAGEHGRGFAVVAEEVGNLAKVSGQAAREIEELLQNSQREVDSIITDVQARVKDGKGVSGDALDRFNEIAKSILEISEKIHQIGKATTEQKEGVEQTMQAMNQLDTSAQENNRAAQDISVLADEASHQGNEIRRISDSLNVVLMGTNWAHAPGLGASYSTGQRRPAKKATNPVIDLAQKFKPLRPDDEDGGYDVDADDDSFKNIG